jgi:hypothetical protein
MFWRSKLDRRKAVEPVLWCSFCKKAQYDVRKLIAGPTVFICDECVAVCNDIIADDARWEKRAAEQNLGTRNDSPDGRVTDDLLRWPSIGAASQVRITHSRRPMSRPSNSVTGTGISPLINVARDHP